MALAISFFYYNYFIVDKYVLYMLMKHRYDFEHYFQVQYYMCTRMYVYEWAIRFELIN